MNSVVNAGQVKAATFTLFRLHVTHWVAFTLLSLVVTIILFLLSSVFVKPDALRRVRSWTAVPGRTAAAGVEK
jgi:hypothetical protein